MAVVSAIAIAAVAVVTCGFFVTEYILSCTENYAHVKSCAQLESALSQLWRNGGIIFYQKKQV